MSDWAYGFNWTDFAQSLDGMAGMVARHAKVITFDNHRLWVMVPHEHRMYGEPAYVAKLQKAVDLELGEGVEVRVIVSAEPSPSEPATVAVVQSDVVVDINSQSPGWSASDVLARREADAKQDAACRAVMLEKMRRFEEEHAKRARELSGPL